MVINSGIANACTGEEGYGYCEQTAQAAERLLRIPVSSVLVASTGVIGMQLPMDRIRDGVALGFVTTDAVITKEMLQKALSEDIQDTYNMVSVDGDTSTNDTVLLLANGMAGNPVIEKEDEHYAAFKEALNTELAKKIAGDGEGATCLFEVKIVGAESREQAVTLSKSVITSSLTKAAIYGHDANWGRILCAMGYSGAQFDPDKVDLYFESAAGKLKIIENGVSTGYSEELATKILSEEYVTAIADMKMGEASATAWGCDLTHEYVNINADYRS